MNIGIGAMLGALSYDAAKTIATYEQVLGKTIKSVSIDDSCLIRFDDETVLTIWDGGQSCCESRYMTCDDDLSTFAGAKLVAIIEKGYDNAEAGKYDECHEQCFVEVKTDNGDFTLVNHNEHNGYYGGFSVELRYSAQ